ncbi:ankyrin repeat domain-containing protein 27 [Erpetoichthys calabaricus]|uniref:ankyrin repeat domain-containing protein 27 n=1 Tax=Erpetoichthys calabaricus TaxID=27687 RepID=UPI0022343079|nr:ankyrin repeat domain-containing protein 27 [Erpetoichthys calabaricus]
MYVQVYMRLTCLSHYLVDGKEILMEAKIRDPDVMSRWKDSVNALYTKCLQCLLRDTRLKITAKQDLQINLLKQAVEMYIHHGIHDLIFKFVGTIEANKDSTFNKTTRSLQDLQLKDLGVKSEYSINIPRAIRELRCLNHGTSPQQKLFCLRKVIFTIMQPSSQRVNIEGMCADDLLSVLLYLLVKTELPNWIANLTYMKNFHFCNLGKDDIGYCLTSFEAAVEFISQGNLSHGHKVSGAINEKEMFKQKIDLVSQHAATPVAVFFEHIANGSDNEVEKLLTEQEVELQNTDSCHPLCSCEKCVKHVSQRLNDPTIVTPFSRDNKGYTPLHIASVYGQSSLVDLLVSKGADINATDYHALTPLHLSCQKGYQSVTLLLLHYNADTNMQDNNGNTPLHLACTYGHEDCVKALVYYNVFSCRLDIQNDKGDTPLHIAARWGYEGIIEVLLENGASMNIQNKAKDTPFQCALNSKILSLLDFQWTAVNRQSTIESLNRSSQTSTEICSQTATLSSMSPLLTNLWCENKNEKFKEVDKLLRAVADGDTEMVRYLFEWTDEESEGDFRDPLKLEFCHPLCQCPKCEPAQQKVTYNQICGFEINVSNQDGFTPLHVAALHGRENLVSLLIAHGANINIENTHGATSLHLACQNGNLQTVRYLLGCNAKMNKKDHFGNTPLIHAVLRGDHDTVKVLLESGASLNISNSQGNTALHEAARANNSLLVELLVNSGASVNVRNKHQFTPLEYAEDTNDKNAEVLRILQRATEGRDVTRTVKLKSTQKRNAMDIKSTSSLKNHKEFNDHGRRFPHVEPRTQHIKTIIARDENTPCFLSSGFHQLPNKMFDQMKNDEALVQSRLITGCFEEKEGQREETPNSFKNSQQFAHDF